MNSSNFRIIYFDSKKGDRTVRDEQELQILLSQMQRESYPESINLESPNGDILTIAIGSDFGFIQYENAASATPSYLIAVDKGKRDSEKGFREVDAGGTPTSIPTYACLPPEKIIEIAKYYVKHLTIPRYIDWEEISNLS